MRQNKVENYMEVAEVVAKRSHDTETQVGAVLVDVSSGGIIATGFNGFIRSAPDKLLPTTRPLKRDFMLHAEENILSFCCKHGISTLNKVLYCTLTPCTRCTRLLWQAGITTVVAKNLYRDFEEQVLHMKDLSVSHYKNQYDLYDISYSEKE